MSVLLKEISSINRDAVRKLESANFCTDSDIRSLTREDLHELFPGAANLKLRRRIFEIIHKQKPVDVLINELKGFIPHDSFRAALTNNGVLVDYLCILKDMKTQMNCVQSFLDAHIGLLEELSKYQPNQEADKGTSASANCGPAKLYNGQTGVNQQAAQGTAASHTSGQMVPHTGSPGSFSHPGDFQEATVKCQMVVSGRTFDAHKQLMDKVTGQSPDQVQLQIIESSEDYQITVVFCPITSRIASDVEAAMTDVKGDKPVILVLMHHKYEVKYTTSMRTWLDDSKVELHVNVFYHETVRGLLKCAENDDAASQIRKKLLEYSIRKSVYKKWWGWK